MVLGWHSVFVVTIVSQKLSGKGQENQVLGAHSAPRNVVSMDPELQRVLARKKKQAEGVQATTGDMTKSRPAEIFAPEDTKPTAAFSNASSHTPTAGTRVLSSGENRSGKHSFDAKIVRNNPANDPVSVGFGKGGGGDGGGGGGDKRSDGRGAAGGAAGGGGSGGYMGSGGGDQKVLLLSFATMEVWVHTDFCTVTRTPLVPLVFTCARSDCQFVADKF